MIKTTGVVVVALATLLAGFLRVERIVFDRGCSSFRCRRAGWEWGWAVWLIEFNGGYESAHSHQRPDRNSDPGARSCITDGSCRSRPNRDPGASCRDRCFVYRTATNPGSPRIQPTSGTYRGPTRLHIETDDDGLEIYYTLDGSSPTAQNATKYEGPFDIFEDATVTVVYLSADGVATGKTVAEYSIEKSATRCAINYAGRWCVHWRTGGRNLEHTCCPDGKLGRLTTSAGQIATCNHEFAITSVRVTPDTGSQERRPRSKLTSSSAVTSRCVVDPSDWTTWSTRQFR